MEDTCFCERGPGHCDGNFSLYSSTKILFALLFLATYHGCYVQVKKNPYDHNFSSTRRKKKVKNATKHWIAAKVKDFLIDDPTVPAKVLQKKLKEHHKVSINYKIVYIGKELVLKQLYGDWDRQEEKDHQIISDKHCAF
jgi:hypothetical protein